MIAIPRRLTRISCLREVGPRHQGKCEVVHNRELILMWAQQVCSAPSHHRPGLAGVRPSAWSALSSDIRYRFTQRGTVGRALAILFGMVVRGQPRARLLMYGRPKRSEDWL